MWNWLVIALTSDESLIRYTIMRCSVKVGQCSELTKVPPVSVYKTNQTL